MKPSSPHRRSSSAGLERQRGAVLIVALIVLVALGLAALSLLRSVDVLGLVSSNLAFQRGSLNATDIGVDRAFAKFNPIANKTTSVPASCYSAQMLDSDARGVPSTLANPTSFLAAYPGCEATTANNEKLYFVVDRQCAFQGIVEKERCILAKTSSAGMSARDPGMDGVYTPAYRVTVRVDGTKNAASYSQVIFY